MCLLKFNLREKEAAKNFVKLLQAFVEHFQLTEAGILRKGQIILLNLTDLTSQQRKQVTEFVKKSGARKLLIKVQRFDRQVLWNPKIEPMSLHVSN